MGSLQQNYGRIYSLRLGSYKFVMAATPEAVKEVLAKKSADYAGRPQTYAFSTMTLGLKIDDFFRLLIYVRLGLNHLIHYAIPNRQSICYQVVATILPVHHLVK